ncbi:MAG: CPBP family intramembrane metalloprotease [Oscillospiraceae bacterium]|nr:CPBP family intramembrane metalloprotease [Oscillospiraceae bacterium]
MGKERFSTPIKKHETVIGWIYLFLHIFVVCELMFRLNHRLSLGLDTAGVNFAYYAVGFAIVLIFLFSFLKKSFGDLCENLGRSATSIILGYFATYAITVAVSIIVSLITTGGVNPNESAIDELIPLNPNVMKAIAVFLAPVVEETLFRGVVFGSIRKSSRVFAYIVSTLLFSVYHLWSYVAFGLDWSVLIYILEYVPASIALAWCYERSRNIWAPIFLHMAINFVSISLQLL